VAGLDAARGDAAASARSAASYGARPGQSDGSPADRLLLASLGAGGPHFVRATASLMVQSDQLYPAAAVVRHTLPVKAKRAPSVTCVQRRSAHRIRGTTACRQKRRRRRFRSCLPWAATPSLPDWSRVLGGQAVTLRAPVSLRLSLGQNDSSCCVSWCLMPRQLRCSSIRILQPASRSGHTRARPHLLRRVPPINALRR
jgi:hypothetical protein